MVNRWVRYSLILGAMTLLGTSLGLAQNPLILDQFTADPTARVFEGKIYVYPSHDILASPGKGRPGWFCMEDYHVFSSGDLTNWKDHGVILSQNDVDWVDTSAYAMWAPDCVFKDGTYYFYFPAIAKEMGRKIGVAVSDKPYGPFKPEAKPIEGVLGIDPCVFIDKDGKAYIYYSLNKIFVAPLKDNMLELAGEPQVIGNLPTEGLIEGPFTFERNGIYYLTYPHVENKTERLEYAIGKSPMGPFEPKGVIMDESPSGCWTNHHSIVEYKGQWYLFYHDDDLSPKFDKNRSIRADFLSFNADGTIQKVIPTLRGVGITDAGSQIQMDRYSSISGDGVSVSFLNDANTHEGWKTTLAAPDAWVRYDRVDFGSKKPGALKLRASSSTGGTIAVRLDSIDGPAIARADIAPGTDWSVVSAALSAAPSGVHDVIVTLTDAKPVDIDW
ncbi:MAG: family 43 glycosylhydrolase, partial [Acidobacteriota bacterium]